MDLLPIHLSSWNIMPRMNETQGMNTLGAEKEIFVCVPQLRTDNTRGRKKKEGKFPTDTCKMKTTFKYRQTDRQTRTKNVNQGNFVCQWAYHIIVVKFIIFFRVYV